MQNYRVILESAVFDSYRCARAANSLDIDVKKKSRHDFSISADFNSNFNVGLIVGASGSGKTTFAEHVWGKEILISHIDESRAIIDQFDDSYSYEECAAMLAGIGLTSVPCWIRPVKTLSNGQRARAVAALAMSNKSVSMIVIDEWTSVVDRTVAKVMSHCVQKFARKFNKKVILMSCHYDVIEWLNPDWIVDCNSESFIDRRLLRPDERQRTEKLQFDIREVDKSTWKYFSKYHYLTDCLPGGKIYLFGLFSGDNQIGFQCFANYVPRRKNTLAIFHSNRTVIHPDYAGMGLGIIVINETSAYMKSKFGFKIMGKFSSYPIYKMMARDPRWVLRKTERIIKMRCAGSMDRQFNKTGGGFREKVKTYSFEYIGERFKRNGSPEIV